MMVVSGSIGSGGVVVGGTTALWKPKHLGGDRRSSLEGVRETIANMCRSPNAGEER